MQSHEFRNSPGAHKIMKAFKIVLISVAIVALIISLGFIVKFLWNITMAEIFGLSTISYWQAVGLFILAKLFFGFGGGGSNRSKFAKKKKHFKKLAAEVDFTSDQEFKKFWHGEGKEAYKAYLRFPAGGTQSDEAE